MTDVTEDQFEIRAIQVKHRPTGANARFATDADDDFRFEPGRAGETLENGEVYSEYDVMEMAYKLLVRQVMERKN